MITARIKEASRPVWLIALLPSLCLAACGGKSAASRVALHPLSVRGALALCSRHGGSRHAVAVVGYFRRGPLSHGPARINGELFDSNAVPPDAAEHPSSLQHNHGLPFGVMLGDPLSRSPVLPRIQDGSRLVLKGTLTCSGGFSSLDPDTIKIVPSGKE